MGRLSSCSVEVAEEVGEIMSTAQSGIFALGSPSHAYLEFDLQRGKDARALIKAMADVREPRTTIGGDASGWPYRRYRGLPGFIDGSKSPSLLQAADVALVAEGKRGAGGNILLLQQWEHDVSAWESLSQPAQERVIGRTKADSIELDPQPTDSHVHQTDQDVLGNVFRRNMPYGTVTDHGTMFVGFCREQRPLQAMLESMVGMKDGVRDALTRYTRPLTGAYYFIP